MKFQQGKNWLEAMIDQAKNIITDLGADGIENLLNEEQERVDQMSYVYMPLGANYSREEHISKYPNHRNSPIHAINHDKMLANLEVRGRIHQLS
jgi:hypothetical protein